MARKRQRGAKPAAPAVKRACRGQAAAAAAPAQEELVGREAELARIRAFVEGSLAKGGGGSLYVCGSAGTGKTASVSQVVAEFGAGSAAAPPRLRRAVLNGNTFNPPANVFVALQDALQGGAAPAGAKAKPEAARRALDALFRRALRKDGQPRKGGAVHLVVVDEIDQLLAGSCREAVLQQLFEWAGREGSNLCLVGIANAVDLHERFLPGLKQRGLAPEILVYSAYDKDQLNSILRARMSREGASDQVQFDPFALELCARKVAAKSGDLRKGLEVCRQAIERARASEDPEPRVTAAHMAQVMRAVFDSPCVERIQALPFQAKLALLAAQRCNDKRWAADKKEHEAAAAATAASGVLGAAAVAAAASRAEAQPRVPLEEVFATYRKAAHEWSLPAVSFGEFGQLISQLAQASVLVESQRAGKKGKASKSRTLQLAVAREDIHYALSDDVALAPALAGKAGSKEFGASLYAAAS